MENCINCGNTIGGLKKMYCSQKCKNSYRWKRMTEEQRIVQRKKNRKIYSEKREERLAQKKEYYNLNREDIKAKNALYKKGNPQTDKRYSNSIKGKYRDYKKGAKKRNFVFEITLEQFEELSKQPCFYCGDNHQDVGVDRVKNKIGYTTKNSVPCCGVCNRMKWAFSEQEFINQCKKIAKFN